jgi:WD40 repeat protein
VLTDSALRLYAFERPTGTREFIANPGPRLYSAAFSREGRWFAASTAKELAVWDLAGPTVGAVSAEGAEARLFLSPAGELFASRDDACFRWRVRPRRDGTDLPGLEPLDLPKPPGATSLCLSANQVFFTGSEHTCAVSLEDPTRVGTNCAPTPDGVSAACADGRWLGIFAPYSRVLHIYRLPEVSEAAALTNGASVGSIEFSPPGDELAVNSFKGVELWSVANWQRSRVLTNFLSLRYATDPGTVWLCRDFHTAGLYEAASLRLLLPLPPGTLPLAVSPEGRYLAVSVDAARLQVWDLEAVKSFLQDLGLAW